MKEGKTIQYRNVFCVSMGWCDRKNPEELPNFSNNEYRIKPEPVKTQGYRRYIDKQKKVWTLQHDAEHFSPKEVEKHAAFMEWIDHEWQYHEVKGNV